MLTGVLAVTVLVAAVPLSAQSAPPITVSGYLQAQYDRVSSDGDSTDRAILRRAMLSVDATPLPAWTARLQVDAGPLTFGGKLLLRDAVLRYTGWEPQGLTVSVGNQKLPFSRAYLTPASRRGLIERPATGLRPFGTPGRTVAIRLDGHTATRHLQWSAAAGSALHRPDAQTLRIDGAVEAGDDWNQGVIGVSRLEWHPLGETPRDQGGFGGPRRLVVGVAGYTWHNDGDRNDYTIAGHATSATKADLQDAWALEGSAGYRDGRTSVDAEYHLLRGRSVDPAFGGGLYRDGEARLHSFSVEAGVMVIARRLEALAAFDGLAAPVYEAPVYGPSLGMTYYVDRHDLKFSVMHRSTHNDGFGRGVSARATFAQAQIAF